MKITSITFLLNLQLIANVNGHVTNFIEFHKSSSLGGTLSDNLIYEIGDILEAQCLRECAKLEECKTLRYDSLNNICQLGGDTSGTDSNSYGTNELNTWKLYTPDRRYCDGIGWQAGNSKSCYYISIDVKTWSDAKDSCEKVNAHLATFTDTFEMEFAIDIIKQLMGEHELAEKLETEFIWTGGYKNMTENSWNWITGERWSFSNTWTNDGTTNGVEYCLSLQPMNTPQPMLVDSLCSQAMLYVCEKDSVISLNTVTSAVEASDQFETTNTPSGESSNSTVDETNDQTTETIDTSYGGDSSNTIDGETTYQTETITEATSSASDGSGNSGTRSASDSSGSSSNTTDGETTYQTETITEATSSGSGGSGNSGSGSASDSSGSSSNTIDGETTYQTETITEATSSGSDGSENSGTGSTSDGSGNSVPESASDSSGSSSNNIEEETTYLTETITEATTSASGASENSGTESTSDSSGSSGDLSNNEIVSTDLDKTSEPLDAQQTSIL